MSSVEKILSNFLYEQDEVRDVVGYPAYEKYKDDFPTISIINKAISSISSKILSGEKNSEYVTFQINRFYDGIDLSTKLINICYKIDNTDIGGSDSPVNVQTDNTTIKFGWIIPEAITMRVCVAKFGILIVGEEYDKDYVFKTDQAQFSVSKGFECGEGIIKPDDNWFEQFLIRIDSYIQEKIDEAPIGEGTKNYNELNNKPSLNNAEISGNKVYTDYGFQKVSMTGKYKDLVDAPTIITSTSQLINNSDFVSDADYIHTDNNLTDELKNNILDNTSSRHTHSNKSILDSISSTVVDGWNTVTNKVDKITGKGLSTNDYTTIEKDKLSNIEEYAQVNTQSDWETDNDISDEFIKNKPTKLSQFINDNNFIDNAVDDLINYYSKNEIYNKEEVNNLISESKGVYLEIVDILPTEDILMNVIYIVPKDKIDGNNNYDEYININGTLQGWEKIGESAADLSKYYDKIETDKLLENKVDKIAGMGLSTRDYTVEDLIKLSNIEDGAQVNSVIGVKGDNELDYRIGEVNITRDNLGLGTSSVRDENYFTKKIDFDKEIVDRTTSDTELQNQINTLSSKSDVSDIIGTKEDLDKYDTETLNINNIIKVLSDNTHNNNRTYYRYTSKDTPKFTFIGEEIDIGTVITIDGVNQNNWESNIKVDKVTGKQLSTEDFTTNEKTKLNGIATGAEINVQSDWNIDDVNNDAFIKNKPVLGTASTKTITYSATEPTTVGVDEIVFVYE